MKKFTLSKAPFEGGRVGYIPTRSILSWLFVAIIGLSHTFAQTLNYAGGNVTGNRYNRGVLSGTSGVSQLEQLGVPGLLGGFYYGSTTDLSSGATLTASRDLLGISVLGSNLLNLAGADTYIQFRYSGAVTGGKTSYVRIGERPVASGLSVPVAGLLSLGNNAPISGSIYKNAVPYDLGALGTGIGSTEGAGTAVTSTTKIVTDKSGVWFAAVTPGNTDDYNSVRLNLRIPTDVLGVNILNQTTVNVYDAFYISPGTPGCNDKPRFAGEAEASGLASLDLAALKLVSLGTLLVNPKGAIDDNVWGTASTLSSGLAGVSALGNISQSFYFDHTATANDEALVKLSVPAGILTATLLGGITVKAYKGTSTTPVNGTNGQTIASSLLGVNLANLATITIGSNTFRRLEVGIKPGAEFDRIEVILDGGVLTLDVLANGLNIHDVSLRPSTPVLTGTPTLGEDRTRKVYVGQTIQPVTATSVGNTINWYRGTDNAVIATGASPLAFPAGLTFPTAGDFTFYATAKKGSCDSVSARSPLYVTVLGVTYSNPPNGTQGVAYSNPVGFTGITGSKYTFTAVTPTQLPPELALALNGTISGTPTSSGSYSFNVAIQDTVLKIPVGIHQYTLVITSNLAATPGPLPFGIVGVDYKDGSSTISIPAPTGGNTPYTYAPQNAGDLPPGLTLNSGGTITGTPTASGTYTFTVNITDNNTNTVSGPYKIKVYPALAATPGALPYGVVGVVYKNGTATAEIPSAAGGSGAYSYTALVPGNLPPGLTFNPDRTITGTPTLKGSFTFTVEIEDDTTRQLVTQDYTIVIGQPDLALTVTTVNTVFNAVNTTRNAILNVTNVSTDPTLGSVRVVVTKPLNFEIEYNANLESMSLPGPKTIHNPQFTKSESGNFIIFTSTTAIQPSTVRSIGITIRKKATSTATTSEYLNVRIGLNAGGESSTATGNNSGGATLAIQN